MKTREKLLIIVSVVACGVSIAVFALVSLGHFIYSPGRTVIPVVGKMYENTVQQVALLEPVPVVQTPTTDTGTTSAPPSEQSAPDTKSPPSDHQVSNKKSQTKNQKNHKASDRELKYDELQKAFTSLFSQLLQYD